MHAMIFKKEYLNTLFSDRLIKLSVVLDFQIHGTKSLLYVDF
jgi:hypothetical protein